MTQKEASLKYMNDFGSISSMEAFSDLGITRLAAVVFDLKKEGCKITSTPEEVTNRYGKKVVFSRYTVVSN